jgi:hypothetical protein
MRAKCIDGLVSHPDRVSGTAFSIIGAFLIYSASPLPVGRLNAPDAGFFPVILATLLVGLGLLLVARSFVTEPFSPEITKRSWAVVLGAGGLLLYASLLDRVGFLICTGVMLVVLMKAYGGLAWRTCLLVGVPLVFVTYVGFEKLGVPLPKGVLGFF